MSGKPTSGELTKAVSSAIGRMKSVDLSYFPAYPGGQTQFDEDCQALTADYMTVYHETGLTPRELATHNQQLRESIESEQARWQNAIYELVKSLSGCDSIDGSGCDSGDPLDLTLSEIQQAWNVREDAEFDKETELAERRKVLEKEKAALLDWGKQLAGELDDLADEFAALQKDAERYRKLLERAVSGLKFIGSFTRTAGVDPHPLDCSLAGRVSRVFCTGMTRAIELCREFGQDPDWKESDSQ